MVWIDQPIGTGFSPNATGAPAQIKNEKDVATDFMGFWKNFMDTFDLTGRKVYIAGESYAGQYIPYIAYYMLEANNTDYYNVSGIQINDPSINEDDTLIEGKFQYSQSDRNRNTPADCTTNSPLSLGSKRLRQHLQPQRDLHDLHQRAR